jgi:hypothetical protein
MSNTPLRVAMLCDALLAQCDARLFCYSVPKRRVDVDHGEFVIQHWLIRLGEQGRALMLEHFNSRWDRERLFGTADPYVMLTRRVDLAPDGRQTPWAWSVLAFGSAWQCIFPFHSYLHHAVTAHPWHTFMIEAWDELVDLRTEFKQVDADIQGDAPRRKQEAALEADLKQRKLWRKWVKREMAADEVDEVIGPYRQTYHAELDALKERRRVLLERMGEIEAGLELPELKEA